jgi:hypothetical protein
MYTFYIEYVPSIQKYTYTEKITRYTNAFIYINHRKALISV